MIEPLRPGFTGTVWEAVPPQQLVREMTAGPGAEPMFEASRAYGQLAAGLTDAATEFHAMLSVLGDAWSSSNSSDSLNQLAQLGEWFDQTAKAALTNATHAAQQAAALQTARATVPHLAEMTAAADSAEHAARAHLASTPLAGLINNAEHQLDGLRQQTARAMRSYESASAALAHPWRTAHAPVVSASANLLSEQAKGTSKTPGGPANSVSAPQLQHSMSELPQLDPSAPQPIQTVPTIPVDSAAALATPPLPVPAAAQSAAPVPAAPQVAQAPVVAPPAVVPPPAVSESTTATEARAGAAGTQDTNDTVVVHAGFATAPAVFGAPATAVAHNTDQATPSREST
ncbi:MAG: PPE domain-containing protein [Mycobacterium sp.]|nr:PPE domain-containing protein [Mycobacterium sp.]